MADLTYTINKINDNGTIDVTFSVDKKKQNLSGLPISDADALTEALANYAVAYVRGLEIEDAATTAHPDVSALVGKPQTVSTEEAA